MCKYCGGERVDIARVGYDMYDTRVSFWVTGSDDGYIEASWCTDDPCYDSDPEDWDEIQVNYCPWCGRRLTKAEDM